MKRDDTDLAPPRARSVTTLVAPIGLVGFLLAQTAYMSMKLGARQEKEDSVAATVTEIKSEMYRRSDAEKDRAIIEVKMDNLTHRVEVLEAARQHQVQVVQTRQERQEDDLLTRAGRWIAGSKK